ncbi:MAG: thiamine pyrophosphate-binding protein [Pirellulaceae bacterium]
MTGADLLVECLAQNGVSTIFGMPGGQNARIYDSLYRQDKIRQILVRNEHAGAFIADGYARATGQPGVCLVTAGPGLTNCMTGLGTAYSDSIPLFVISGQIPRKGIGKEVGYFHEMDHLGVTAPLTKWNATAQNSSEIPELVRRAFQELKNGRPRPVHLDLPVDLLAEETDARPRVAERTRSETIPAEEIQRAADLLQTAERPLIIAGGGVVGADACRELLEVAHALQAPILTTPMGKGCAPDDHPLAAGMMFNRLTSDLSKMDHCLSPLPNDADVVLAVGCRFSQVATANWSLSIPGKLIQIDIDGSAIGRNYPAEIGICGCAKAALTALAEALPGKRGRESDAWKEIRSRIPVPERWQIRGFDIAPILRRVLDRDAIIACDMTRLYYMLLANFPAYEPRSFLHSSCFIAMGYGLPAALGAKAAFPQRQVVAVAGDGGFLMTSQELACAVQEKLPVITIVINDRCLSAIKGIQKRSFDGRYIAVDLVNPDFVRLAEAYGALGLRVQALEEFEPALHQALEADRPALIEIQAPQTAE